MTSKPAVIIALVIVLLVLTLPFWYALASGPPDPPPELATPAGHCVEKNMAARHMQLLAQWRDEVMRDGVTERYESKDYPDFTCERSLTRACIQCHSQAVSSSGEKFCQQCHDYADVRPDCWNCHVGP